jgi:diguanylate cyclase (GGDEF)-like protein
LVPVGYMNEERWKNTVQIYQEAGALRADFDLTGFIYDTNLKDDLKWAYRGLLICVVIALVALAFLYYNMQLNKRLKLSLDQLNHLSQHDPLTGLPNRILFSDRLQRAILKARRDRQMLALLFIDVDHFKAINDSYGHQEGDELLQSFAKRMVACIRDSDSFARIGGDEFVVLLEDLPNASGALEVAKKIQASVSAPVSANGSFITTTASIGIALYPEDAHTDEELMKCADLAMYEAKQAGRNKIYFYSMAITQKMKKL